MRLDTLVAALFALKMLSKTTLLPLTLLSYICVSLSSFSFETGHGDLPDARPFTSVAVSHSPCAAIVERLERYVLNAEVRLLIYRLWVKESTI